MQPRIETSMHPNGQIHCQTPYVDGKIHGVEKWWWKNGQIESQTPYVHGKRHGIRIGWWSNGNINWLDFYRSHVRLLEINMFLFYETLPTNRPLFNKSQFKKLCNQK